VHGFAVENYLSNLDAAHLGRASQFAIAAARLALADANVEIASLDLERAGVSMGTTSGEPREVERFDDLFIGKKLERVGPEFLGLYPSHVIAAHIARELRFAGINIMIPTACAAGNYAIAHAFDVLRAGRADLMLAGGSDSFSRITYTGFAQLGAIAPEVCQGNDSG
jgi:3-oxoacyl-[acyl-carrier-protein] synthase II